MAPIKPRRDCAAEARLYFDYEAGEYWISYPGIDKAYSIAERPEDIVSQARAFLQDQSQHDGMLPAPLDEAITDPTEPFEGTRLVIFEWEPPA